MCLLVLAQSVLAGVSHACLGTQLVRRVGGGRLGRLGLLLAMAKREELEDEDDRRLLFSISMDSFLCDLMA